jgi:hypothetical protein
VMTQLTVGKKRRWWQRVDIELPSRLGELLTVLILTIVSVSI